VSAVRASYGLHRAQLVALVEAGFRAPSGDNVQPWRIAPREDGFDVWFDPRPSILDVDGIASRMATGAFLENVRLAAAAGGLIARVTLDPIPSEPQLWARVTCTPAPLARADLARAIHDRHTSRELFDRSPLEADTQVALIAESRRPVRSRLLTDRPAIARAAGLVGVADRIRARIQRAHEELYAALRWSAAEAETTRDGLDVRTLGTRRDERFFLRLLRPWTRARLANRLGADRLFGRHGRRLAHSASAIGLLTVPRPHLPCAFAVGSVLQRTWLRATLLGLSSSPMTVLPLLLLYMERHGGDAMPPGAARTLRDAGQALRDLFALDPEEQPIVLYRVGRGRAPTVRSLRRRAEDVLR
jgi:hypothetical protein